MIMNNSVFLRKNTRDFCFVQAYFYLIKWIARCILLPSLFIRVSIYFFLINSLSISYLFSLICRYRNKEHENDSTNDLGLDFERVVYVDEFSNNKDMEDDDLPPDLLRLVAQDEKQICPIKRPQKLST